MTERPVLMPQLRRDYRERLAHLEDLILEMGNRVLEMLDDALRALSQRDVEQAAAVIRADDRLDEVHDQLREEIITTIALQAPVAGDLRLLSAMLLVNLHLERMGDLCVNIGKFVQLVEEFSDDPGLMAQIMEMGGHANNVISRSLEALARRDLELVWTLPELDDPLDQLNKGLFRRLVELAARDESRLDWAMRMVLVARYLERMGDHAVDIGEQVIFAVTGESVELASNSPVS